MGTSLMVEVPSASRSLPGRCLGYGRVPWSIRAVISGSKVGPPGDRRQAQSVDKAAMRIECALSQAEAIDPSVTSPLCAAKAASTSSFSRGGTPK
jgi:hypothetical protein